MAKDKRDALIALLKTPRDLTIASERGFYRIPVKTALVPRNVKERSARAIAFYQPKTFGKEAFAARLWAEITGFSVQTRREIFPDEPPSDKSDAEYHVLSLGALQELPQRIENYRRRRLLFIPTTRERLFAARDINEAYYESALEERLWGELRREGMSAERQYVVEAGKAKFVLDFALLCKGASIGLECDGDAFHLPEDRVKYDKRRDNILESLGWHILRFSEDELATARAIAAALKLVKETVKRYGGLEDATAPGVWRYPDESEQGRLFG